MDTRATIICSFVFALLYVTGSWASVFDTDRLKPTLFEELKTHQCLPTDFDFSITKSVEQDCLAKITAGGLPEECTGPPVLALFYNCLANNGRGLLTAMPLNATNKVFNSSMASIMARYSNDKDWLGKTGMYALFCSVGDWLWSKPVNTRQQLGVHNSLCIHMNLIHDCNEQQEKKGILDQAGKLRRIRALSGDYRDSPNTVKNVLKPLTNRTLEECSQGLYTGDDVNQLYKAQISRILCFMEDFIDHSRSNDIIHTRELGKKIFNMYPSRPERTNEVYTMHEILSRCGKQDGVDPTKFVECWASSIVSFRTYRDANEVASQFPEACVISIGA